ncbi:hypothetical protein FB45DRAFT_1021854 [Roridomyces roridus]|uniref:Uncharacterized protein n=1 Tax=Roridomyces roridus TaxID=1738132 RepID=A0AAD7C754_9AGAR|nr:hypothetical protein FB45DRAFT_1021854 [Roridomyces roridus]
MSSAPLLKKVNLSAEGLLMDIRAGRDGRYWCIPPFRFDPQNPRSPPGAKHPFYIVCDGHIVGLLDNWSATAASIKGFRDPIHQGCDSVEEGIEIWQGLCPLGVHPHPPAPQSTPNPSSNTSASSSPRKRGTRVACGSPVKREHAPASSSARVIAATDAPALNFAIRSDGIVSSSAQRTEHRYLEMQRQGEEPDMLVTRDVLKASLFAVADAEDE